MPTRFTRAFFAMSASAAVTVALGLGAAGTASASVTASATHAATPECLAMVNCTTPDLLSPPGSDELVLEASAAAGNAPVVIEPNDPTDFFQDWTFVDLGTVGSYINSPNTFGLTGFDFANYFSDEMFQLEFSPGGIPSGWCVANVMQKMILRWCNGSKFQTYIATDAVLGTWFTSDGTFGLSVEQARVSAHHLAATGSRDEGSQVTFSRPLNVINQDWDALDA